MSTSSSVYSKPCNGPIASRVFVTLKQMTAHVQSTTVNRFDTRTRKWLVVVAALAAVFCCGMVLAPWLEQRGSAVGSLLRLCYSPACHQMPERCLDLGLGPWAVCARCAGLYFGGLAGLFFGAVSGRRVRPQIPWIIAALVPSLVDFALAFSGLPSLSNWPRFLAALAPGFLVGLLLTDAIADITSRVGPPASSE